MKNLNKILAYVLAFITVQGYATTIKFDDFYKDGDDGIAVMNRILNDVKATNGKQTTIVFSKKLYNFPISKNGDALFELKEMKNVTIDGNGATIVINPCNSFSFLRKCENIVIKNFITRYSIKDFTQGFVSEVNANEGYFTFRVQDGYPLLPSDDFVKKYSRRGWAWGSMYQPDKTMLKFDSINHVIFIKKIERTSANNVYKIFPKSKRLLKTTNKNDRFLMSTFYEYNSNKHSGHVSVLNSANITFENLEAQGIKGMSGAGHCLAFFGGNNDGLITIKKCKITYRDKGDLTAGVVDGVHFKNNKIGPHILGCHFEGILDDHINISANPIRIVKDLGNNKYKLSRHTYIVKVGSKLGVYYANNGKWLEGITVIAKKGGVIETDKPIPDVIEWIPQDQLAFTTGEIWKNQNQTHLYSMDYLSDNFKVADNYFGIQRVRSIVVRSRNGIIENNTFENSNIGIWISNEAGSFHEGPIPQNIVVRNNVFRNIQRNCVLISAANSQKNFVEQLCNLKFCNNTYYLSGTSKNRAILITNGHNITFENETFYASDGSKLSQKDAIKKILPKKK